MGIKHYSTHASINSLLSGLRELKYQNDCFGHFPKDSRTLLKTQGGVNLQDIGGGQYYHFGV
jgi:hypothetical protein